MKGCAVNDNVIENNRKKNGRSRDSSDYIGIVEVETTLTDNSVITNPIAISKLTNDITELFIDLAIPTNVKGFEYLRYAIILKCLYPEKYWLLTKALYPEIAKHYSTTCTRVERACRYAIERGYSRGNMELYDEIFGHTVDSKKGNLVNSVFITTLSEYINHNKRENPRKSSDECEKVIEESVVNTENLMKEITDLLKDLGVPANIMGFEYLRRAILLKYLYPEKYLLLTKELYPEIAEEFQTTSNRIRRAIRNAITATWNRGNIELLNQYFENSTKPEVVIPSNNRFIIKIAQLI